MKTKPKSYWNLCLLLLFAGLFCAGLSGCRDNTIRIQPAAAPAAVPGEQPGVSVLGLNAIAPVSGLVWLDDDTLAVLSCDDGGYLWIYRCDVAENTAKAASILRLEDGECMQSAARLKDGLAVVTQKRILFWDEQLQEKRALMLPSYIQGSGSCGALSPDGAEFLYLSQNAVYRCGLDFQNPALVLTGDQLGENGELFEAEWIGEGERIAFRYSELGGAGVCGAVCPDGSGRVTHDGAGILSFFGRRFAGVEADNDPSSLRVFSWDGRQEDCYTFEDNILCALAEQEDILFGVTLNPRQTTLYFQKIDLCARRADTLLALDATRYSVGNRAVLSAGGKAAIQLFHPDEGNTQLLILDLAD